MNEAHKDFFEGKTVLVTGGAGAIGTNLSRAIAECGAKTVIILDDLSSAYEWNIPSLPNILFVKGDVRDDVALKRVFTMKPTIVYHLAAFFANQNSVDYPEKDLLVSTLGTVKMLEYSVLTAPERFIYAGSGCAIYGAEAPLPLREEFMSMHLSTPYQISKMTGELYCNFYHHHYGLPVVKTRFFNSYGPGEVPGQYRNVIPNFIYWAMLGLPLPITGTGDATRDFTYVGDIVDALLRAAWSEKAVPAEMNIASGCETTIKDLADRVNKLVGSSAGIAYAPRRKWDTKSRLRASIDRASELLGYAPKTSFDVGLVTTIDWFKANWERIRASAEFPPGMSSAVSGFAVRK
jgi:UDP-glucose 4-epimerase